MRSSKTMNGQFFDNGSYEVNHGVEVVPPQNLVALKKKPNFNKISTKVISSGPEHERAALNERRELSAASEVSAELSAARDFH